ncbi:DNA internalization-related competence protein ComEC/Rec2 [Peribacillus saganii]|uniref:DNA internalization-related competence protein ComEC/Rec2 n=1 Tax=Peribacillus saganii TaxID=2303992 RepID=A0A372LV16_9BACI|nr:DNA internalization-related competence protein ComEC/Rec2 [Peribacillus saganii]RFU71662.1 DNA internalization-related competence protein ComEC/Rec2 [Peribacillus saganii]
MKIQLLLVAVSAILGVTAFSLLNWKILCCITLYILYMRYRCKPCHLLIQLFTILLFFLAAALSHSIHKTSLSGNENQFLVSFTEIPDFNGNMLSSKVDILSGEKFQLRYKISSEPELFKLKSNIKPGISCHISGTLSIPERNRNENEFDYRAFLASQHIYWILTPDNIDTSSCMERGDSLSTSLKRYRMEGIEYIDSHFPEYSKGFISALIFGERNGISEEDLLAYQRLGLVHLLAISGLHIAALTGFVYYLGIRCGVTKENMKIALIIILPVYGILAGGSPSVLRSVYMAMGYFGLSLFRVKLSALNSICAVFLLLLLLNPQNLFDIGFQLSFSIVFCLAMSKELLLRSRNRLREMILISLVCQLGATPILLFHFYELSILGILLNIIFVPLYSYLLLPLSIISFFISFQFPKLADILLSILDKIFLICNAFAQTAENIPFAYLTFGKPSFVLLLFLSLALFYSFIIWDGFSFRKSIKPLLAAGILLVIQYHMNSFSPYGEITFIDVGQGDSILISLPYGRGDYLIDTGGQISFQQEDWKKRRKIFDTGNDIVVPLLKSKGIRQLDKLIITHPDADHAAGAAGIIKGLKVKQILIGEGSEKDFMEKGFLDEAVKKSIPVFSVKRGDSWKADKLAFYVLNPDRQLSNTNDSSIVILTKAGSLKWLFMGDAGEEAEKELIEVFPGLKADVIKAGHHGSKTSSSEEFIKTVNPKAAIISSGKDNRYGHPHKEVLDRLHLEGTVIMRTDKKGAIKYRFTEKGMGTFSTVLP